jgi:hypothetical protein
LEEEVINAAPHELDMGACMEVRNALPIRKTVPIGPGIRPLMDLSDLVEADSLSLSLSL